MITWISKTSQAVLACVALTACDALPSLPVLDGLSAPKATAPVALSQSKMGSGAFTLVPPQGYCIDQSSLKQRFALMARCDTLGVPSGAAGAPLGVLSVSITPQENSADLPTPEQITDALKLARIGGTQTIKGVKTFHAEGPPPSADLEVFHWRGIARLGGHVLSITFYSAKGGRGTSGEGRDVINELVTRSRAASESEA